jgi:hypothetical protein
MIRMASTKEVSIKGEVWVIGIMGSFPLVDGDVSK